MKAFLARKLRSLKSRDPIQPEQNLRHADRNKSIYWSNNKKILYNPKKTLKT